MKTLCSISLVMLAVLTAMGASSPASATTFHFSDVAALGDYAAQGVTFSGNAWIWRTPADQVSVLTNPNGTWYSTKDVLCFTPQCGGATGSAFFATPVRDFSVVVLSGPGPDLLGAGTRIEAFDANGHSLGVANANPALQFQVLTLAFTGITRVDFWSPGVEIWDDLGFTVTEIPTIPEPSTALLLALGCAGLGWRRRQR